MTSRFLIDTHVWLWLQAEPSRLPPALLDRLGDESNDLFLSAASVWEITIKYALGKLSLPDAPKVYVPERMRRSGTQSLSIESAHALAVAELPLLHRDPFDRALIAQATILGLTLVTADARLTKYDVDIEFVD